MHQPENTSQRFPLKRLLLMGSFLALMAFWWFFCLREYITLDALKQNAFSLQTLVEEKYVLAAVVLMAACVVIAICALPMLALATVLGGFLFGVLPATLYVNVGATLGALIFFLLVRYIIGAYVQTRYAEQLISFNRALKERGWLYLLLIRCVPFVPFFVANAVIGLTKVPLRTFVWTTAVGIVPTSLVYAYAGRQMTLIHSISDVFSWQVLLAFGLLILVSVVPFVVHRFRK